jgi:hypothetical protein
MLLLLTGLGSTVLMITEVKLKDKENRDVRDMVLGGDRLEWRRG